MTLGSLIQQWPNLERRKDRSRQRERSAWLGSGVQWTTTSKDRGTPEKRERERGQPREIKKEEKRETLTARVFRSLWNSAGLRFDF